MGEEAAFEVTPNLAFDVARDWSAPLRCNGDDETPPIRV